MKSESEIVGRMPTVCATLFGILAIVSQNFIKEQKAIGRAENPPHKFYKPVFQALLSSIGMLLCLVANKVQRCIKRATASEFESVQSSINESVTEVLHPEAMNKERSVIISIAIPSVCEIFATLMQNVGLIYLPASLWQMLHGSLVVFSSLLFALCSNGHLRSYSIFGILVVLLSLVALSASAILSSQTNQSEFAPLHVSIGLALTIGSQLLKALQIIIEQRILRSVPFDPLLTVGIEGCYEALITIIVFLPLFQIIGSERGGGIMIHEDTIDTLLMEGNNWIISLFTSFCVLFVFLDRVMEAKLAKATSPIKSIAIEASIAIGIWVFDLAIHYSLIDLDYGYRNPDIGEKWSVWSFMELAGFILLFTGILLFNGILRIPIFSYEFSEESGQTLGGMSQSPLIKSKHANIQYGKC